MTDVEDREPSSPDSGGEEGVMKRKRRRGLLRMYYGVDEGSTQQASDPLDIDKTGFQSQQFMDKLLKESSLNQLYVQEDKMKKEIQELDSQMQYLVYENHSKFIKASETIREMKDDFQHLEDDMTHLSSRVEEIISSSNTINSALSDRKKQITKLCGVHHLLKKLQFLFELPTRLNKCITMGFYAQAVRTYCKAQRVLEQYQHMPSFHGIQRDCAAIVSQLKDVLKKRMDESSSTQVVAETVDLLLELGEEPKVLCQQFLEKSRKQLEEDLTVIAEAEKEEMERGEKTGDEDSEEGEGHQGVQEYVGVVCNGFLANVSLVIQSCYDMFIRKDTLGHDAALEAERSLRVFVSSLVDLCLGQVRARLAREACHLDSVYLVRALDKLSGKMETLDQLIDSAQLKEKGKELVGYVAQVHTDCHCQRLQQCFTDALMSVRQSLASSKTSSSSSSPLNEHCSNLYSAIKSGLEVSLSKLKEFLEGNVAFSMKADFRHEFCSKNVREGVVIQFISYVLETCKGFTESGGDHSPSFPPTLILVLSRLVHDMERSTISYLVSYGDERFQPREEGPLLATPTASMLARAKEIAQTLLDHYVKTQGGLISQMIRKSVETRDWLNTIEPRNVRSVMKRVVEEVGVIDRQVGSLYKEGAKREQGSEGQGSRHTYNYSLPQGRGYSFPSHMDSSLLSNIQKLFYERIEVFGTVEFAKLSITTGIIKIFLKAFLECVRLRTFGKYGLQQMQVDNHYLQVYLWRYVYDEQLVKVLLEQVVSSTMERCVEPQPMEQSVVEVICGTN